MPHINRTGIAECLGLDEGEVELALPTGTYRCDFDVPGEPSFAGMPIDCDDTAASTLQVRIGSGSLTITGTEP